MTSDALVGSTAAERVIAAVDVIMLVPMSTGEGALGAECSLEIR